MAVPESDPFAILELLLKHEVPFVVIGGHAVIHHGYLRTTEDTDIVFRRTPESEEQLASALHEINACWIANDIDAATGLERLVPVDLGYVRLRHMMLLWTDLGFLDIFDYIPGLPDEDVEQLFRHTTETEGIQFVSREWLIRMKQTAGRPKDLDDIENLSD